MMYVLLLVGFVLLIKGADFFVEGSSSLAKILRVPSVIIGLTIVAMGTSAPEAAVSVTAGLSGNNDIALGNVLGSNLFNLLVVVGVCALIKRFTPDEAIMKRDFYVSIAAALLVFVFLGNGKIGQLEGIFLLLCMTTYIVITVLAAIQNREDAVEEVKRLSPLCSVIYIVGGVVAVILGGNLVVDNASLIAETFGLSQNLIALTIVAIGTSLPELVTSIVAAKKGESGLALGNVVGSNIFNLCLILGLSTSIHPITVSGESVIDMFVLIVMSVLIFLGCKIKGSVGKLGGAAMVLMYAGYTVYIILR